MYVALRYVVFVVAFASLAPPAPAQTTAPADAVSFDLAWDHVALSVPNIEESIAWYGKMLGFKEIRRGGQPTGQQTALIRRGNINIELFQLPNAAPLPESRRNPSEDFPHTG